jgi:excinuclease ABC subunit B
MRPVSDLQRKVSPFQVISDYVPAGDQPVAIEEIARRINDGVQDVVLLGATGTGKSATTAWLIEKLQRPTLVLAPNKLLAAQLANEFKELLPNNAVEYFVSYYDYYQPEAYVPQTDTFIEKDSSINDEVERLRHSATNSLLTRRDVIVVATVSCIYGLGTPQEYVDRMIQLKVGDEMIGRSIIDSQFFCRIEDEVLIGDKKGITPSVAGQAWITGKHIHTLDPTDPWPLGYKLSDTWPNKL